MASYDTSDIRKGLKVMLDGSPFTVVEFQFVKPGKGAAFTRTKLKNLLTGGVIDRNLRSGENSSRPTSKPSRCSICTRKATTSVFMDTSTYDQVHIPEETIGDDSRFMPEQIVG